MARTVDVSTVEGGAVALECDFLPSSPTPRVRWLMNSAQITEMPATNAILFLDGGRYLFINALTAAQRSARYQCEVTNVNVDGTMRSPTTYYINEDLPPDTFRLYRPLPEMTVFLEDNVNIVFAGTQVDENGMAESIALRCPGGTIATSFLVSQYTPLTLGNIPGNNIPSNGRVEFTCEVIGSDIQDPTIVFNVAREYHTYHEVHK